MDHHPLLRGGLTINSEIVNLQAYLDGWAQTKVSWFMTAESSLARTNKKAVKPKWPNRLI